MLNLHSTIFPVPSLDVGDSHGPRRERAWGRGAVGDVVEDDVREDAAGRQVVALDVDRMDEKEGGEGGGVDRAGRAQPGAAQVLQASSHGGRLEIQQILFLNIS